MIALLEKLKASLLEKTESALTGFPPMVPTRGNIQSHVESNLDDAIYELLQSEDGAALGELLLSLPDQKKLLEIVLDLVRDEIYEDVVDTLLDRVELEPDHPRWI